MGSKKPVRQHGVPPIYDAASFLRLVNQTKPLFRRGSSLQSQYEILRLRAENGVFGSGKVIEELYRRMRRDLNATLAGKDDLLALQRHLQLRQMLDDVDCIHAIELLGILKEATREEGWPCPDLNCTGWPIALQSASTCFEAMGGPQPWRGLQDPRTTAVGLAGKELRRAGYPVRVVGTHIDTSARERDLLAEIDRLASAVGGLELAERIFEEVKGQLDPDQNRYHLVRHPESTRFRQQDSSVPYGYLLSLAIKHVAVPKGPSSEKDYKVLTGRATALAAIYDVEPYFKGDGYFNDRASIVPHLQDTAAFDALFTFPQCNPIYVPQLITELFCLIDEAEIRRATGTDLATLAGVARALLTQRPQGPMLFTTADIVASAAITLEQASIALDCYTHEGNPNANVLAPLATDCTRFWDFPLLKARREFMLIDAAHCAPAFYEAVLSRLRTAGVRQLDKNVGLAFERFILGQLKARGLNVHSGKYVSSLGEGECDAVVETQEAVVFLELKKKCLTRKARSADSDAIVADLTFAMLDPHCQTGGHALALISDGRLELRSDTATHTVELRSRKIERLAISLPEFGAFHTREITSQVLQLLTGALITATTLSPDVTRRINESCSKLAENYALAVKLGVPDPDRYFNCWFLGADALLTLLENVQGGPQSQRSCRLS